MWFTELRAEAQNQEEKYIKNVKRWILVMGMIDDEKKGNHWLYGGSMFLCMLYLQLVKINSNYPKVFNS